MPSGHGLEVPEHASSPLLEPPAPDAVDPQSGPAAQGAAIPERLPVPGTLPVVDVRELDWQAIRKAVDGQAIRARLRTAVEGMETLLDRVGGPGMLFDADRAHAATARSECPHGRTGSLW